MSMLDVFVEVAIFVLDVRINGEQRVK